MKIRNILLGALVSVAVCANAQDTEFKYRRSSIYSVLVNHTNQQFAGEIKEAFLKIPVPDKFNDHNLSVKVLNLDKKRRTHRLPLKKQRGKPTRGALVQPRLVHRTVRHGTR